MKFKKGIRIWRERDIPAFVPDDTQYILRKDLDYVHNTMQAEIDRLKKEIESLKKYENQKPRTQTPQSSGENIQN